MSQSFRLAGLWLFSNLTVFFLGVVISARNHEFARFNVVWSFSSHILSVGFVPVGSAQFSGECILNRLQTKFGDRRSCGRSVTSASVSEKPKVFRNVEESWACPNYRHHHAQKRTEAYTF